MLRCPALSPACGSTPTCCIRRKASPAAFLWTLFCVSTRRSSAYRLVQHRIRFPKPPPAAPPLRLPEKPIISALCSSCAAAKRSAFQPTASSAMKLVLPPALRRWLALFPVSFPERMRRRCSRSAPSARRRAPFCSSTGVTRTFSRWMSTTWTLCIAARRSCAPSPRRISSMTSSSRQSFAARGRLTATCS